MKRFVFAAVFSGLLFTACNLALSPKVYKTELPSIALDLDMLNFTDAVAGRTCATITATLEHSDESLEWYSTDAGVVTVEKISGNTCLATVAGQGSADVVCQTADGSLIEYCRVTVQLGHIASHPISSFTQSQEIAPTSDSVSFSWTPSSDATQVRIDWQGISDPEDNGSQYFDNSTGQGTVTSLYQGSEYMFTAYGVVNGGTSAEELSEPCGPVNAWTEQDLTAPGSVTEVKAQTGDHKIVLSWNEPADADYKQVVVTLAETDLFGNSVETRTFAKGTTSTVYENLKSSTDYEFTFRTADKFGNTQGDSNNVSTPGFVSSGIKTAQDTTAPSTVTNVAYSVTTDSITISWTDPDDFDALTVTVEGPVLGSKTVPIGSGSVSFEDVPVGTSDTVKLTVKDYDSNSSREVELAVILQPMPSTVGISRSDALGKVNVNWTDFAGPLEDAVYIVEASATGLETVSTQVEPGIQTAVLSGLRTDVDYTFAVKIKVGETVYYDANASSCIARLPRILWQIKTEWGGRVLVPFKTAAVNYDNVVLVQDDAGKEFNPSVMTYAYWILHSPLDGSNEGFSLEASDADGNPSGLFMYTSESTDGKTMDDDVDNTGWGGNPPIHHWTGTVSAISEETGSLTAAVYLEGDKIADQSTYTAYSDWKNFRWAGNTNYYWFSANSNAGVKSDSGSPTGGDYKLCYKQIFLED